MSLHVEVNGRLVSAEEWAKTELPKQLVHVDKDGLVVLARVVLDEGLAAFAGPLIEKLRAVVDDETGPLLFALERAQADAVRSDDRRVTSVPLTGPLWAAVLKDAPVVDVKGVSVAVVALAEEGGVADVGDARGVGAALLLAEHIGARVDVDGVGVVPVVGDAGLFTFPRAPDVVEVMALLPRPLPRLVVTGAWKRSRVVLSVHDLRDGQEPLSVDATDLGAACTPLVRAVTTLLGVEKHRARDDAPPFADLDDEFACAVGASFVSLCVATKKLQAAQASAASKALALWTTLAQKKPSTSTSLYRKAAQKLAEREAQPGL